jgi:hypothetical protein
LRALLVTLFLMLSLPLLSVKADTCDDVKNFTNEFNSQLPLQVDEITTVTKADYDCRTKNIVIVKEISVTINQLNSKNKLWKSVLKTGWEKQICNLTDADALTDLGWEFIQRLIFDGGSRHNTIADCVGYRNGRVSSKSNDSKRNDRKKPEITSDYTYYNRCNSFGSENCYNDIVHSCNLLYPRSDINAQTQFNRMGCIADSINATLSPSSEEHRIFLSHYLIRKGYFEAALKGEITSYQAYEMSENTRYQLNSSLESARAGSSARQRCLSRCLMNNKAGSGGSAAVQGLNYCANLCN